MQFNSDKILIILILIISVLLYYSANLSNSNRKIKSIEITITPAKLNFIKEGLRGRTPKSRFVWSVSGKM